MPTNLSLDDNLIEEARRVGGHSTKRQAVTAALDEYVRRRKQVGVLQLFGKVEYAPDLDHVTDRRRDHIEDTE